jgi:hypothetical protein
MENILVKLLKPFITLLFPKPLSIVPIVPLIAGGVQAAIAGGATATAAGAGIAGLAGAAGGAAAGGGILSKIGGVLKGKGAEALMGALGTAQEFSAGRKSRQAEAIDIPLRSLEIERLKEEAGKIRRDIRTGARFQPFVTQAQQLATQQFRGALQAGGSGGATIKAQQRAATGVQSQLARLVAASVPQELAAFSQEAQLGQLQEQRALEIQMLKRAQLLAEAAQRRKGSQANILAALAGIVPTGSVATGTAETT